MTQTDDGTGVGDEGEQTHSVEFDWDGARSVSSIIVSTIEGLSGREATDLPPLHDSVDVDAMNQLFQSRHGGGPRTDGSVTVLFAGYIVTVYADGLLVVRDADT